MDGARPSSWPSAVLDLLTPVDAKWLQESATGLCFWVHDVMVRWSYFGSCFAHLRSSVDVSDIFLLFFLVGGGRRGGRFFIENPRRGGGLPGGWGPLPPRGWEGVCGEFGGGGLNIFFRGRNSHQVIVRSRISHVFVGRKHPSRDVIFSGQNLAKKCEGLSHRMTSLSL